MNLSALTARMVPVHLIRVAVMFMTILVMLPAAAELSTDIASRYPKGSILSVQKADEALADAAAERRRIEESYLQIQAGCYDRFFTFACLGDAKELHRIASGALREVEVDARYYKRYARAYARDKSVSQTDSPVRQQREIRQ